MEQDILIEFKDFGFKYNAQSKPTLYDIDLKVRRGEKILIAGPSGCGKSTLVHCINGLIPFSYKGEMSGSLKICGKETGKMSLFEISKTVGTVLQDSDAQFVGMTVAEDIAFALENDCVTEPDLHEKVRKTAELVGVSGFLEHAPSELSGGQKQRVSVAGVMVDDVSVLIFDEPLANLDPATGKSAVELIDDMQRQTGATVIIVEHRLEDVLFKPVDRVVLMYDGRIRADLPAGELLSGDLLRECGIREPLYITALKYAGVDIRPEMSPDSMAGIRLSDADKEKVRNWYANTGSGTEKELSGELLRACDLDFTYAKGNVHALNRLNVTVRKGEMTAIVGTNGAGKSTFAKVICGFETEDSGKLYYKGQDMAGLSIKERADHVGYVMQNPNRMISKVFVHEEASFGLKNRGVSEDIINAKTERALRICGLWRMRNWPVSALSYGQKKRLTVASILTMDPELIILDEPTAGQDYRHYTEIMEFLSELNRQGITILMVTHDMHLMLEYADRAIVFSKGQIIADDRCERILTDRDIIKEASLKETSLYGLAMRCGIEDGTDFVRHFIAYERKYARGGSDGQSL